MDLKLAQQHIIERMVAADIELQEAQRECQLILQWVTGTAWLELFVGQIISAEHYQKSISIVERRERREPLQYCLGEAYFRSNKFVVRPGVLIPRPETEHLVEVTLAILDREKPSRLLEIGSGSGAIAVSLLRECPSLSVLAVDISEAACAVTRQNALLHEVADRLSVACLDWRQLLSSGNKFNGIVSNPPYIAPAHRPSLLPEVAWWEPPEALFAAEDGLFFYREFAAQAAHLLVPDGFLACELGHGQYQAVACMWQEHGWSLTHVIKDLSGIERVVVATAAKADLRNVN